MGVHFYGDTATVLLDGVVFLVEFRASYDTETRSGSFEGVSSASVSFVEDIEQAHASRWLRTPPVVGSIDPADEDLAEVFQEAITAQLEDEGSDLLEILGEEIE